jgi:hypothetical protein
MNMAAARHNDTAKLHLCDMTEPSLVLLNGTAAIAGVKDMTAACHQYSFQQREGKVVGVSTKRSSSNCICTAARACSITWRLSY